MADHQILYEMYDEDGEVSAQVLRMDDGRVRFVIYGDEDGEVYVDMTPEVARQVQTAIGYFLQDTN